MKDEETESRAAPEQPEAESSSPRETSDADNQRPTPRRGPPDNPMPQSELRDFPDGIEIGPGHVPDDHVMTLPSGKKLTGKELKERWPGPKDEA